MSEWKTGGYWHNGRKSNSHKYKVTRPITKDNLEGILNGSFDFIYETLGKLGYHFKDAGNNRQFAEISMSRRISPKHLRQLENILIIKEDSCPHLGCI